MKMAKLEKTKMMLAAAAIFIVAAAYTACAQTEGDKQKTTFTPSPSFDEYLKENGDEDGLNTLDAQALEKKRQEYEVKAKEVDEHNQKYARGETTYYKKVYMKELATGLNPLTEIEEKQMPKPTPLDTSILSTPDSVDWRLRGTPATGGTFVNPIRNQRSCGSCAAFAAVGALETHYAIKTGALHELSEQQMLSCNTHGDDCGGGWYHDYFSYVQQNNGINSRDDYEYVDGPHTRSRLGY